MCTGPCVKCQVGESSMELHYRQPYEMTKSSPPGGDHGRERASFKVTLLENGPI